MGRAISVLLLLIATLGVSLSPGCTPVTNQDLPTDAIFDDVDGDGQSPFDGDCDDNDPNIFLDARETCDDVDQDCDEEIDEDLDADGDGYSGCSTGPTALDCDDAAPSIFPGAQEVCDGLDNNCNGQADEIFDGDRDGYSSCEAAPGDLDCDDSDSLTYPGSPSSICDGKDNDCDDDADEGFDSDEDGFHVCAIEGKAPDCDDSDDAIYPGADETCDGEDEDCDGDTDEGFDQDRDGFEACDPQSPFFDCDDSDRDINPDAQEVCGEVGAEAVDEDCDGLVDDNDPDVSGQVTFFHDGDGDGAGDPEDSTLACSPPSGYVAVAGDCDDSDAALHPGTYSYPDVDGDGFGDDSAEERGCIINEGWILTGGDCDDSKPEVYADAPELCDETDNDCDSLSDEGLDIDADGDGVPLCDALTGLGDCDDTSSDIYPDAPELCDGLDNDCDATSDEDFDTDLDGVPSCAVGEALGDCNDSDPAIYPGAEDDCDGIDQDCDEAIDELADVDGDGFVTCESAGELQDCLDSDALVYPGAEELCDGADQNCDGVIDDGFDADNDGFSACAAEGETPDCDDGNPSIYPGRSEICDGVDTNCSGGSGDIYVAISEETPADYRSIQLAIDGTAGSGCVIEVAPGVYPERVKFKGKAVVVRSEAGAEATTIDGTPQNDTGNAVIRFTDGERSTSVLQGFTITGGVGYDGSRGDPWGGGVFLGSGVGAILRDLIISGNRAEIGGGVACDGCSGARLENVQIHDNEVYSRGSVLLFNGLGGGLAANGGSLTINGGEISTNFANVEGGGISLLNNSTLSMSGVMVEGNGVNAAVSGFGGGLALQAGCLVTAVDSTFLGNRAFRGGGIYLEGASSRFVGLNITVESNIAAGRADSDSEGYYGYGGGVYLRGTSDARPSVSISYSEFLTNIAGEVQVGRGGGIFADYGSVTLGRTVFEGNSSDVSGGAVNLIRSSGIITNSVFRSNTSFFSGGVQLEEIPDVTLVNNVFHNNRSLSENTGASALLLADSNGDIFGNIFIGNDALDGGAIYYFEDDTPFLLGSLQYNDFWMNAGGDLGGDVGSVIGENGNISVDPLFVALTQHTYILDAASPLLDGGHPDAIYNDVDGSRNQMGIYGGPNGDWDITSIGSGL